MDKRKFWREPNLSTTKTKRQHYVPQLFLRSFAIDDKIRVFDLNENKQYITSVANAAVVSHFYDEHIAEIQLSAEDWLSQLEGRAIPVIEKLVNNPDSIKSLSVDEEFSIARFLVALRFRTPAFRDYNDKLFTSILGQIKDIARKQIYHQYSKQEADDIWKKIKNNPDHWWYNESESQQPATITNFMLSEVQGFANILRAAPWRIGIAPDIIRLYTSDNPVAGYLHPVRIPGEGTAFSSFTYCVPLSPRILLEIDRRPDRKGDKELRPCGERRRCDFSEWEISFARHVVTNDAIRYLFGEGSIVSKDCAASCLERIDRARLEFAIHYLGYDPRPPWVKHD